MDRTSEHRCGQVPRLARQDRYTPRSKLAGADPFASMLALGGCADGAVTGVREDASLSVGDVVGYRVDAARYRVQIDLVPEDGRRNLVLLHVHGSRDGGRDALVRRVADGIASGRIALQRRVRFSIAKVELRSLSPHYVALEWLE